MILLIEDEANIRNATAEFLAREGLTVETAASLAEASLALARRPKLVLLDWMLPDGQGIEWLKSLKTAGQDTPVILLTARNELIDKVLGLELGADDYVTKPFEARELLARIRVQLRKRQPSAVVRDGERLRTRCGIEIDLRTREVRYRNLGVELTKLEFVLLTKLVEAPGRVYSREELLRDVWGMDKYPTTRTVDTHILQLRGKFGGTRFETVHGVGYRFRDEI